MDTTKGKLALLVGLLVLVGAVFGVAAKLSTSPTVNPTLPPVSTEASAPPVQTDSPTPPPITTPTPSIPPYATAVAGVNDVTPKPLSADAPGPRPTPNASDYKGRTPGATDQSAGAVPHSAPAADGYFSDALFIGDSGVLGIFQYGYLPQAQYCAQTGIGVYTLNTADFEARGGTTLPFDQALRYNGNCTKIYIQLGMNDMGDTNAAFAAQYALMIARVRAIFPTQPIYVMALMPVSQEVNDTTTGANRAFTNAAINGYNQALLDLCLQTPGLHYLAVDEPFRDAQGNLQAGIFAGDGKHIRQVYYQWWIDYLYSHIQ